MGKNRGPSRVDLDDYKAKKAEEGSIEIKTSAGVFTIPPPELWDDEVGAAARANDDIGAATVLLGGPERYAEFVKAGGSATVVWSIIKDEKGATLPESSGSSTS